MRKFGAALLANGVSGPTNGRDETAKRVTETENVLSIKHITFENNCIAF